MLSPFEIGKKNPMRGIGLSVVMNKREKKAAEEQTGRDIPTDLLISIFSRVPAKSVARFRCMSKQWASILRGPHFSELFLTQSSAHPRFLFAIRHNCKWLFFSSPHPLHQDNSLSTLAAYQYKPFPTFFSFDICPPVHGLICTKSRKPMICNPSTGQYKAFRKEPTLGTAMRTFFGYYPINQIFKVLSVCDGSYQVSTLGMGELSWRMLECSTPHFPLSDDAICIGGVLYYIARCNDGNINPSPFLLVCFDVRLETFKFLGLDKAILHSTLINCKGKVGAIKSDFPGGIHGNARIQLLVLDDANANIWSERICVLPRLWSDLLAQTRLEFAGMAPTGEIVLSPCYAVSDPFCIFYYNVERNTIVIVEIKLGVEANTPQRIYTFLEHLENVKPMKMLRAP